MFDVRATIEHLVATICTNDRYFECVPHIGNARTACEHQIICIRRNSVGGKVQPARSAKIEPGCEIVVPSKPERKYNNPTQWVSIASMSASMASVVATIVAVIKK